ncbi:MAG: ribonuclease H-like domain-containing protein [Halorientalis sp.]
MSIVALDLETVPTVKDPDFGDPSHWEIFCIGLAHRSARGNVEAEVLIRETGSLEEEEKILDRMCRWCDLRGAQKILTYNGKSYDYPILRHRGGGRVKELLEQTKHIDLYELVYDRASEGESCSLDAALDRHGIDVGTAVEFEGQQFTGEDMPRVARALWNELVTGERRRKVLRAAEWYAMSDVRPLFDLHDTLVEKPRG